MDPFTHITPTEDPPDLQGWSSNHPLLREAIESRPTIIVEVGVWKGGSVVFMANRLRELRADSVVIAVDTWLGSWEHWRNPEWRSALRFENGFPTLFRTFQENVVKCGVARYVVPLPLDSINAAALLRSHGVTPELVHVDAGHDYRSVYTDLEVWWERLAPEGAMIVDDYDPAGEIWSSVKDAVDTFAGSAGLNSFENDSLKALLRKPATGE